MACQNKIAKIRRSTSFVSRISLMNILFQFDYTNFATYDLKQQQSLCITQCVENSRAQL